MIDKIDKPRRGQRLNPIWRAVCRDRIYCLPVLFESTDGEFTASAGTARVSPLLSTTFLPAGQLRHRMVYLH